MGQKLNASEREYEHVWQTLVRLNVHALGGRVALADMGDVYVYIYP